MILTLTMIIPLGYTGILDGAPSVKTDIQTENESLRMHFLPADNKITPMGS